MKKIILTDGSIVKVDDSDYLYLSKYSWHNCQGYARRTECLPGRINIHFYIHRIIAGDRDGLVIDHINRNPLDNRRKNLRHVTRRQNMHNMAKYHKGATSKYKGVYWYKKVRKWHVQIRNLDKKYHVGYFENEHDAAIAYNRFIKKLRGAYAYVNPIIKENT